MLNIEQINSIIRMLNLSVKRTNDGKYEITNYTASITDSLNSAKDQYEYNFIKDEINYHLTISNNKITITNNLNESIAFSDKDFEYCVKKSNKNENKVLVTINNSLISFYQSRDIQATQEEHYNIGIKALTANKSIPLYKVSESLGLNGTLKKETTIVNDEDEYIKTDTERHYNEHGKLTNSTVKEEKLSSNPDDYILEDFASHDFILELLDRLETIMPGITNTLVKYNNTLGIVLEKTNIKTLNY